MAFRSQSLKKPLPWAWNPARLDSAFQELAYDARIVFPIWRGSNDSGITGDGNYETNLVNGAYYARTNVSGWDFYQGEFAADHPANDEGSTWAATSDGLYWTHREPLTMWVRVRWPDADGATFQGLMRIETDGAQTPAMGLNLFWSNVDGEDSYGPFTLGMGDESAGTGVRCQQPSLPPGGGEFFRDGEWHNVFVRHDGAGNGVGNFSWFIDGAAYAAVDSGGIDDPPNSTAFGEGWGNRTTSTSEFSGQMTIACMWGRDLEDGECALLSSDPYGILREQKRTVFIIPTAAAGGSVPAIQNSYRQRRA